MKRNAVIFYNILNALAPLLLFAGIVFLILSGCGELPEADSMKAFSVKGAIISIALAILIRIVWGVGTGRERKRLKAEAAEPVDNHARK